MDRKAYQREYQKKRCRARKRDAIKKLGGRCCKCGSVENLELDHKDPKEKYFSLSQLWGVSSQRWEAEIAKCQLLCRDCHQLKSILERGQTPARGTHGTLSAYRYCKCDLCRAAKSKYNRDYRAKRKARSSGFQPDAVEFNSRFALHLGVNDG